MPNTVTAKVAESRVEKKFYGQTQAGFFRGHNTNLNVDLALGGEISKNGTFGKLEVGVGSAIDANLEAGHEFNIGKNMGLEISANTQYVQSMSKSKITACLQSNNENAFQINHPEYSIQEFFKNETSVAGTSQWHDGYFKAGAGFMLNFKGKKGKIGIGAEAGYKQSPDVAVKLDTKVATMNDEGMIVDSHNQVEKRLKGGSAYVTPKISAELNLGKKGHWSAVLDADLNQGKAGIRYTF